VLSLWVLLNSSEFFWSHPSCFWSQPEFFSATIGVLLTLSEFFSTIIRVLLMPSQTHNTAECRGPSTCQKKYSDSIMVQPPSMEARRTVLSELKNIIDARSENRKILCSTYWRIFKCTEIIQQEYKFLVSSSYFGHVIPPSSPHARNMHLTPVLAVACMGEPVYAWKAHACMGEPMGEPVYA